MILIAGGVAIQVAYTGWGYWRSQHKGAAAGAFLLAALTLALPIALALTGG